MKCKYCQSEIEDGVSLCPNCGEVVKPFDTDAEDHQPTQEHQPEPAPQEEAPQENAPVPGNKMKTVVIILCALLLGVLVGIVVSGINRSQSPEETTPPTMEVTVPTVDETKPAESSIKLTQEALSARASYTVSADVLTANADNVVLTAGTHSLTTEQLQVFYWMQYINFIDQNGYYAYMLIDSSVPFDQQTLPNSSLTWEQYFLDGALSTWHQFATLCTMAEQAGFTLDQSLVDSLAEMPQLLNDSAVESGYASAQEMIETEMGPGCTVEGYVHYTEMYYTAISYFNTLYEELQPTEEQISTYYEENKVTMAEQGITEALPPYVDVRHILIMPTGGTADASGNVTYSEAEWEACRLEAQSILDAYLAGEATEDAFAQLANEHSADGGSNTTGGLYTYVTDDGTYVPEFTAWCMEEGRQVGDTGLVKTTYGYHIMYYVKGEEAWHLYCYQQLLTELCTNAIETQEDAMPLSFQIEQLELGGLPVQETAEPTTPTTGE